MLVKPLLLHLIVVCVHVCGMSMCAFVRVRRGMYIEVRGQYAPITLLLSFICVVSRDGIQMVRFGNKHLSALNAQNTHIVHYFLSYLKTEIN